MWPLAESLWADAEFAIRQLMKNSGFAVTAILTLALGTGATTAIFSLVNTVLLRPLPVPRAVSVDVDEPAGPLAARGDAGVSELPRLF